MDHAGFWGNARISVGKVGGSSIRAVFFGSVYSAVCPNRSVYVAYLSVCPKISIALAFGMRDRWRGIAIAYGESMPIAGLTQVLRLAPAFTLRLAPCG